MTRTNCQKKKILSQIIAATMLSSLASFAGAGTFTLDSSEITLSSGSDTTPSVASTGLADQVTGVAAANNGIPNIDFDVNVDDVADGTYEFKLGITFDDDNSDSRVEVYIPTLEVVVAGNAVTGGQLDASNKIRVLARDDDGSINVDAQVDIPTPKPISISGNTFSFNMAHVITAISGNAAIQTVINNIGNKPRHFTYQIFMQETTAGAIQLGVNSGTFAALPRIQSSCANNTASQSSSVFTLTSNALASNFTSAYGIQGQYSVTGAAGSAGAAPTAFSEDCAVATGGGGTPATGDDEAPSDEEQASTNTDIENELGDDVTEVSDEVVEKVNNAIDDATAIADKAIADIETLTADAAINSLENVGKSIALAGTAASKNGAVDKTKAASTITSLANALGAVNGKTLNTAEKAKVVTLATNAIDSASTLISDDTSVDDVIALVSASSKVLAQASTAGGAVVSESVTTKVKDLAKKAISSVITKLPAAATAGVDLTNTESVKTLMKDNPSVLQLALTASANLPTGASITIGEVSFTREELIAQGLAAGVQAAPLQGGLNFQSATTGFTVTTDSTTGNMTLTNGTETYVAASPVSRLVPDTVPDGISYLPNGTAVLVGNGVATELAPTAFDQAGFTSAVSASGFALTYRSNGTISIALGNNEKFSGAFAFDNLGTATSCGAISVTSPTGNPAAADYAFTITCADGVSQRVTPIPDNATFYATVANAGLNAKTDRNTGVVTINTVGSFKPSFFVTPLTINDTAYYEATKNSDGIAFRASDKNGDGKTDYEILSADGVQVLYGL